MSIPASYSELPAWVKDQGRTPLGPCPDYQADNLQRYPVEVCTSWGGCWICNKPDGRSCYWRGLGQGQPPILVQG